MSTAIDTGKVTERRQLHFHSLDDILAELDRLAAAREIRTLGNWSAGQNFQHLALVMNKSIDGFDRLMPAPVRWLARLVFLPRMLKKGMTPGFKLPGKAAEILPPPISTEEGLQNLRHAIHRIRTETHRCPHSFFGNLTNEQWNALHCRHAELHLSFLEPVD
jgi:hypothetical protein